MLSHHMPSLRNMRGQAGARALIPALLACVLVALLLLPAAAAAASTL